MTRTFLLAGASLLALSASVTTASAAPIFSDTTPGLTSTTLAPGTYDIPAFGAQGGGGNGTGSSGGPGAEIGGAFVLTAGEVLTVAGGGGDRVVA